MFGVVRDDHKKFNKKWNIWGLQSYLLLLHCRNSSLLRDDLRDHFLKDVFELLCLTLVTPWELPIKWHNWLLAYGVPVAVFVIDKEKISLCKFLLFDQFLRLNGAKFTRFFMKNNKINV